MSDTSTFTSCERFLEETRDVSPADLLIKIERLSLFCNYVIDKFESRVFEAGGNKWKMIIYREGCENENDKRNVSVKFAIAETESLPLGWEVNAIFTFFVYNQHKNSYLSFRGTIRRLNALITRCGFSKVISTNTLIDPSKGFLVDDSCVFGAEVYVIKDQPTKECLSLVDAAASFKREWKISGFSKLLKYHWTSEEFKLGGHNWNVELFPYSVENASKEIRRYLCFFLNCVDIKNCAPHHEVNVETVFSIKRKMFLDHHSIICDKDLVRFSSASPFWGQVDFVPISFMHDEGFLVDDCCFLEVEISVLESCT